MDIYEKILLLQILMIDIRMSWDRGKWKRYKDNRVWKCLELIDEFNTISCNQFHAHYSLLMGTNWIEFYHSIGLYLTGRYEGRILRNDKSYGGYEGLESMHGLIEQSISVRSSEFCDIAAKLIRSDGIMEK